MSQNNAHVHRAKDLQDALNFKAMHPNAHILAGGTDFMLAFRAGSINQYILNILPISELKGITTENNKISIGALTNYTTIINSPILQKQLPILVTVAKTIGAKQIQNRGTIGGNVANASPAGDSLPVLLALDCELEIQSKTRGKRIIPIAKFFKGYRSLDLQDDEILTRLWLSPQREDEHLFFRKIGTRKAQSISKVSFCGKLQIVDGIVKNARIAFGSVAATPIRCYHTENALLNKPINPNVVESLDQDIQPISDIRSTASYRLKTAKKTLQRWLSNISK